jgi:hypothetical protein
MDDIQVIDSGLYESLGFDGMGLPTGVKFDPDSIPRCQGGLQVRFPRIVRRRS